MNELKPQNRATYIADKKLEMMAIKTKLNSLDLITIKYIEKRITEDDFIKNIAEKEKLVAEYNKIESEIRSFYEI